MVTPPHLQRPSCRVEQDMTSAPPRSCHHDPLAPALALPPPALWCDPHRSPVTLALRHGLAVPASEVSDAPNPAGEPYADGPDLYQSLRRYRDMPPEQRWRRVEAVLIELCQALIYIHRRGLVHRD